MTSRSRPTDHQRLAELVTPTLSGSESPFTGTRPALNAEMKIRTFLLLLAGALAFVVEIAGAAIIYSGERNIILTGQPESTQELVIDVAGETGDLSDDLTLSITLVELNSVGANVAGGLSGVALGSSPPQDASRLRIRKRCQRQPQPGSPHPLFSSSIRMTSKVIRCKSSCSRTRRMRSNALASGSCTVRS